MKSKMAGRSLLSLHIRRLLRRRRRGYWEVCQGSADFKQTIRLNPGFIRKPNFISSSFSADSVIKAALPLPGPPLASFPQEAHFEITILSISGDNVALSALKECDRTKLIQSSSGSPIRFPGKNRVNSVEEIKIHGKCDEPGEGVKLSVGLIAGGSAPSKLPGSYPGSIGFNSDGSVLLDGIKLVFESEKEDWGRTEKVVGCGFELNHRTLMLPRIPNSLVDYSFFDQYLLNQFI